MIGLLFSKELLLVQAFKMDLSFAEVRLLLEGLSNSFLWTVIILWKSFECSKIFQIRDAAWESNAKQKNHVISFESVSKRLISDSIHELSSVIDTFTVADPRRARDWPPTDQHFLNFMHFFGKIWQICMLVPRGLAPPPTGNPRSASDLGMQRRELTRRKRRLCFNESLYECWMLFGKENYMFFLNR